MVQVGSGLEVMVGWRWYVLQHHVTSWSRLEAGAGGRSGSGSRRGSRRGSPYKGCDGAT